MPLGPGRRGPGVIGRPVVRTAAVVAGDGSRGAPGHGMTPGRGGRRAGDRREAGPGTGRVRPGTLTAAHGESVHAHGADELTEG